MLHLDLFSGIGGFSLAADTVFENIDHIFIEWDTFCQQVLKKHWPGAPLYGDIKKFDSDTFHEGLERVEQSKTTRHSGQSNRARGDQKPFLLTGGFPCQPFSAAGARRGTADDRYLWPEMLRVIRLTAPQWVIAENVGGLVTWNDGLVLETVCTDLEAAGYDIQPFIIPAVAVDAPHRRDRIWFVAHANGPEQGRQKPRGSAKTKGLPREHWTQDSPTGESQRTNRNRATLRPATDTRRLQGQPRGSKLFRPTSQEPIRPHNFKFSQGYGWQSNWMEVAARFCSVDDGLPAELDGFKLTKSQHRKEQLKAYGNAIVPQVAMQIMEAMV